MPKNILVKLAIHVGEFLLRKCLARHGERVYTFREKNGIFYVGYWSATSGQFINKAEVPSEEEARELIAHLNSGRV